MLARSDLILQVDLGRCGVHVKLLVCVQSWDQRHVEYMADSS